MSYEKKIAALNSLDRYISEEKDFDIYADDAKRFAALSRDEQRAEIDEVLKSADEKFKDFVYTSSGTLHMDYMTKPGNFSNILESKADDYLKSIRLGISFIEQQRCVLKLAEENDIKWLLNRSIFSGFCDDVNAHMTIMTVGLRNLFRQDVYSSALIFVSTVLTCFHLLAHKKHIETLSHISADISECIMLNHYACKCSLEYQYGIDYKSDGNTGELEYYYKQAQDIAAEYDALFSARSYFARVLGDVELAEDLILGYVNTMAALGRWFVNPEKPFTDLDEIKKAFEDAFLSSQTVPKDLALIPKNDILSTFLARVEQGKGF